MARRIDWDAGSKSEPVGSSLHHGRHARTVVPGALALAAVVILAGVTPTPASAQSASTGEGETSEAGRDLLDLDLMELANLEISVETASRSRETSFHSPSTVDVLKDNDIRMRLSSATYPDIFEQLSGVSVQKTARGQGSPYIRGFTGYHNLMMIDGIRFNTSVMRSGPNQYWATIDPLSTRRTEVAKGTGGVLYGSDAVGSSVNLYTPEITLGDAGDGMKLTGRGYGRRSSAEDSWIARPEIGGSYGDQVGFLIGGSFKSFGDFTAGSPTGENPETGWSEYAVDGKFLYRPAEGHDISLVVQRFVQQDVPRTERTIYAIPFEGTTVGNEQQRDSDQERTLAYLRYAGDYSDSIIDSAKLTVSYQRWFEERDRIRSDGRRDLQGFTVDDVGMQAELTSPLGWAGDLTYGLEYYLEWVDSWRDDYAADGSFTGSRIQGAIGDDSRYYNFGAYVQDKLSFFEERFNVTGGVRYTRVALESNNVEDPVTGLPTSVSDNWDSWVGSGRISYRPDATGGDHWNIYAKADQGFRAPNLSDMTSLDATSAVETPSFDLQPEKFLGLEGGVKLKYDRVSMTAAYFYTFIDDLITQVPTGADIGGTPEVQKTNSGNGYVQGVEVGANVFVVEAIQLWAKYSFLKGEVDQIVDLGGGSFQEVRAPVSRIIPHMFHWGVLVKPKTSRFWGEVYGSVFSDADQLALRDITDTRRIPPGGTPGFWLISLRGGASFFDDQLRLSAGLENLLDVDYRIHGSGQNGPGLNFKMAAEMRF